MLQHDGKIHMDVADIPFVADPAFPDPTGGQAGGSRPGGASHSNSPHHGHRRTTCPGHVVGAVAPLPWGNDIKGAFVRKSKALITTPRLTNKHHKQT